MIAGLFGLGGPEMLVLLLLGGMCFLAVTVGAVVLIVSLTRDKKSPSRENDD